LLGMTAMNHRLHQAARALALCALILALAACAGAENGNDKAEASGPPQTGLAIIGLEVGGVSITVEVADTHDSRETGLMHR
jgi:hypothetical protein